MNESANFGLKTTQDTDQWRNTLDYHNENMGVIDAVLAKNQDALGIIVDGNKAAVSATTGQYIILRNSTITGKTDGLYTAAKSIPANTAIDGTYLTAVSGGGLNALNGNLSALLEGNSIRFYNTLSGNVCTNIDGVPEGISVFTNSNNPTNQPPGCSWGSYIIFKNSLRATILYVDYNHIAFSYSVTPNSSEIGWKVL